MHEPKFTAGPDLLADPLFKVQQGSDTRALTIPALLARLLAGDEIDSFVELSAEQRGHVWRFWVRCAAKVLHELGLSVGQAQGRGPEALAAYFRETLAALAPEGAWKLYQPDAAKPGFLQIPTPDGAQPGAGNNYKPNSLGLLTSTIGGKNHERKADVARELTTEQAAYALIEYQTSAIYAGRGNYESQLLGSRSGAGSGTPFMGARIGDSSRETIRHDVQVVLDGWAKVARGLRGPVWALWAEPWNGKDQLASERLDPAFIPAARMVRLGEPEGDIFRTLWFRPTDTGRVRDHTDGGALGDPLTPLVPDPKTGAPKVRGTLRKGYDYTEVVRLLFPTEENGTPSPSVQVLASRGDNERTNLRVVFAGTAYEQGKTGGFHRREVLLPPDNTDLFADPEPVRFAHEQMLQHVKNAKGALRGAARILLNGELRPRDGDAGKTDAFAAQLEQRADAAYLEYLWAAAAARKRDEENCALPWARWLSEQAEEIFRTSLGMLPSSTGRRWERETSAEAYLKWKLAQLRGEADNAAPGTDPQIELAMETTEEEEEQPA
jgi:hypothetical protein